jgi:hypothetical protein
MWQCIANRDHSSMCAGRWTCRDMAEVVSLTVLSHAHLQPYLHLNLVPIDSRYIHIFQSFVRPLLPTLVDFP